MFQNGTCHTQITFRIFKVNRIHFVRHGAGTYFTGFNLLLEIFHGNILPEVTVHIDHYRIYALHSIEYSRQIIIIRNLRSIFFTFQAQFFSNKPVTKCFPVELRISHMMRIVISGSTTELGSKRTRLQSSQLAFKTIYKYHHLFPQASR